MTTSQPLTLPRHRLGRQLESARPSEVREAMQECANERIREPGEMQPFGAMLVVRDGVIERATANASAIFGRPADELIGQGLDAAIGETPTVAPLVSGHRVAIVPLAADPSKRVEVVSHQVGVDAVYEAQRVSDDSQETSGQDIDLGRFLNSVESATSLETLLETAVQAIRDQIGYDRVMAYRFDDDYNGAVVAEATDDRADRYLGLHYPASDIPSQARELYLSHRVRMLQTADYDGSPLMTRSPEAGEALPPPLDMSRSLTRSMSPIHRRYLRNMGVGATLSLSLVVDDRLWGLIACHHDSPRGMSFAKLETMRILADLLSMRISVSVSRESVHQQTTRHQIHRRIIDACHGEADLVAALRRHVDQIAELVNADGVVLWFGDEIVTYGSVPQRDDLSRIVQQLLGREEDSLLVTDSVNETLGLDEPVAGPAVGLIAMEFWPGDLVLMFREEQSYAVRWAGQPTKSVDRDGDGRLQPRASFSEWVEEVGGRSLPWTEDEEAAADTFRNSLAVHIIRRSQELEELNRQLRTKTAEVERFVYSVSHDLKAPLVTCRGFLGLIRDDLADGRLDDVPDSIDRAERAAETMSLFISELLEFSRLGQDETESLNEQSLNAIMTTVLDNNSHQVAEAGLKISIGDLPEVIGRETDLIRVFENLINNALKYACDVDGDCRVEISSVETGATRTVIVRDFGPGIPKEFHAKALRLFQRVDTTHPGSGVGLATVVKILESVGGTVRLENPEGGGLAVVLNFPRPGERRRRDRL